MSNVLARLSKKRAFPIVIDDETFHVRSLTIGELKRLDSIKGDNRTGFVLGCALVEESGQTVIPKNADETDDQWSERVLEQLSDVPTQTIKQLSDGVAQIGKTPNAVAVEKN